MFKSFQNTSRTNGFNGFPALNFQMNNEAYGFSGCTFWLDAAYGTNTQTDLAAVSTWQSRIGGITFTQATAGNQPRYIAADANFNNLPSIQFQDTSRRMSFNNSVSLVSNFTLIGVCKYDTLAGCNTVMGNSGGSSGGFILGGSDTSLGGANGPGVLDTSYRTGTTENTNSKIVVWRSSGVYVNGIVDGTYTTDIASRHNFDLIGNTRSSTFFGLSGRIAELLIFNYQISDSNISVISTNINSKYAIY